MFLKCLCVCMSAQNLATFFPGDYVTPESGTLFTHEQGRSLTETCLCLNDMFYTIFLW